MANEETKMLSESNPMKGGDNPYSYAKNSAYQRGVVDAAKDLIFESVAEKLDIRSSGFESPNPFCIADFGCSVGPNTFIAVQNIIEAVDLKYKSNQQNPRSPEFRVFFNDHTDNDFNTLFRTLPPSKQYFAAGVPGSFHGRLFPESTVHFAHSSYALQWLSKLPEEVVDRNSPSFNKDHVHCTGTVREVAEAYLAQYCRDMGNFFRARFQELLAGALMVILLPGVPNGVLHGHSAAGMFYEFLGSCLRDMAKMGLITEEKVDSFNLPLYFPSEEEIQALVEQDGFFSIEKIKTLRHPISKEQISARFAVLQLRAAMEGLVRKHFGSEIVEDLFERYEKKVAENLFISTDDETHKNVNYFILLKRKSD